MAIVELKLING
ncbi:Protein of unknown function [Lactobacillus delbrueckii subsp. lactis]|nr:Protein of unknown function [Lactobacillus delbrueckii subsp. lactis]